MIICPTKCLASEKFQSTISKVRFLNFSQTKLFLLRSLEFEKKDLPFASEFEMFFFCWKIPEKIVLLGALTMSNPISGTDIIRLDHHTSKASSMTPKICKLYRENSSRASITDFYTMHSKVFGTP